MCVCECERENMLVCACVHACSGTSCANRHIIERMTSSPFGLKQHILKTARTAGGDDRYREQESFAFHEMIFISMHTHTYTHTHTHTHNVLWAIQSSSLPAKTLKHETSDLTKMHRRATASPCNYRLSLICNPREREREREGEEKKWSAYTHSRETVQCWPVQRTWKEMATWVFE